MTVSAYMARRVPPSGGSRGGAPKFKACCKEVDVPMKKIKPRRRHLRINSPMSFGVLCALILLLVGGAAYGLAAGIIAPAVQAHQATNATIEPSIVQPNSPTPGGATLAPGTTPDPNATLAPGATPDPNATVDPNATPVPLGTAAPTVTPAGRLAGRVIGIDAAKSRGSKYSGVSTGVAEYRINFAYANAVKTLLEAEGATVVMTRTAEDEIADPSVRIRTANDSSAEIVLSIMCNYIDASQTRGTQMIVPSNHDQRSACDRLATCVLDSYVAATDMPTREVGGEVVRHLTTWEVLNGIDKPVAAIVLGHLSNSTDDRTLNDPDFLSRAANAIVDGIVEYFAS